MCGFTGYIDQNRIEKSIVILEMLELQRHRGPDDSGIVGININDALLEELPIDAPADFTISPNLIFGFNRLSILDVSPAGHQPMMHQGSKVSLMMNGEIYNAFDFKPELESKGYDFKGNSDTEVVLYMYLEYGLEKMLAELNGMFALAIYDGREKALFLVRDRMGIKPLYVLKDENHFAFSSEMKSFKALPDFKFELDESKLSEFLLFRNAINETLFKDIVNITPGTYWRVNANNEIETHTYYDLREEGSKLEKFGKAELESALRKSVKRQMISDVKLGCQLSGGVDSSLVTAYAAESLSEGALETVSIVFDEANYSEKRYIDEVAKSYNLKSHQFTLNAQAYLDLLDEAVWHFEQPINHPNTIGIKLLSREARKHVTVLLSGEGADESMAGYSRFLPPAQEFFNVSTVKKALKNRGQLASFYSLIRKSNSRYILQTAYGGLATAAMLYPNFSARKAIKSRIDIWNSISNEVGPKRRKYELLSYLPDLLMRQDKMSMAHSIENRVPFLDNEMIEAALSLDEEALVKRRKGVWEGKWTLKELCADAFNEPFAYRNKMGFGIPLKSFFSSKPFQSRWIKEILPGIKRRNLFNAAVLEKWMNHPQKMNSEQLDSIWLMLSFEIWAKQYLD
jgi:asparagine synthase (glutamine-hydrolysing)